MSDESCPVPSFEPPTSAIERMLNARRIAVVGLSDDPSRPSFRVASYLLAAGKEVIPVNPRCQRVLGLTCHPSLAAAPGPIDLVDVFRRPEFCADVVRDAIVAGARGVWLQSGIVSDEARELAGRAKLDYVEDRCLMVDLMRQGRKGGR
jgi:uncharacterized protein